MALYNADLKPLQPGVYTHPYQHATKLFLSDNYRLAPKQSFLYYVCINVNTSNLSVGSLISSLIAPDGVSSQTLIEQYETGLMAKRVDLPKFSIGTKTLNSYNRKNIITTNISYEPITITFHDDVTDIVNTFWNDYYTYYFRDSDYTPTLYQMPHKYQPRLRDSWGFTPRNSNTVPFLKNIQIFSLHNKRFTEYLLINPFITSWRHGEHTAYDDNGILENSMTVAYETVKYRTGYVNAIDVNGFGVLHYDNVQSPISTSTTNIYTDSGLVGAITGGSKDLARPDGTASGIGVLGNILNAYRSLNALRNVNFGAVARQTLGAITVSALNQAINGALNSIFVPTQSLGSSSVYGGTGILSTAGSPYAFPANSYSITSAGQAVSLIAGSALQVGTQLTNQYVSGVITNAFTSPVNKSTVYQVQTGPGNLYNTILVGADGKPVTNQQTSVLQNDQGDIISSNQVLTTQTGTYNPNAITDNLVAVQTLTDSGGNPTTTYTYTDGTRVTFDSYGTQTELVPGKNYNQDANLAPAVPLNTRDLAAAGQTINASQPQYYTDPRTGVTYSVGGTAAQITNTISGTTGLIAGGYAATSLNSALNSTFLGKSVLGQAVSAGISGAVGMQVGKAINNGLQPILGGISNSIGDGINSITSKIGNAITQGWDSFTGTIKNVTGSFSGSGSYDPKNPLDNVVSNQPDGLGGTIWTYKDGTTRAIDAEGVQTITKPSTGADGGWTWPQWGQSAPGTNSDTGGTFSGTGSGIWVDGSGNPVRTADGGYVWQQGADKIQESVFTGPMNNVEESVFNPTAGVDNNPVNIVDSSAYGSWDRISANNLEDDPWVSDTAA